jgi:hypothetical protein
VHVTISPYSEGRDQGAIDQRTSFYSTNHPTDLMVWTRADENGLLP